MHDSWEGSRAEMSPRQDARADARPDARGDGRVPQMPPQRGQESRVEPRSEPRIQEARMYPSVGELRGYPQRGYEGTAAQAGVRGADAYHPAAYNSGARNSESYPAEPRPAERRPFEPQQAEPRVAETRPAQPYRSDARMQELGQRVQAFGAPAPQGDYRGAPLPVGQPQAGQAGPTQASGYERGYPARGQAGPQGVHGGGYAEDGYPHGIPPSAPEPAMAEASSDAGNAGASVGKGGDAAAQERPQLPAPADGDGAALKGGFQRVAQAVRAAIPLVQKLLPLLDGNLATTVSALLAPQTAHPPAPPQVHVDLEPVERGMTELRVSHRELKTQVAEQGTTLKRVEDHLERVREATDRNTLEQQELVEDVRAVGARVSRFIVIGVLLLALSVGLNVYLLIQLQHIFR